MALPNIAALRLINQQIEGSKFKSAKKLVDWMGAMQAQDYAMAKWALGIRLSDSTDQLIEQAIDKGEIIRTHLLRPTWHFVSSDDIYWMLGLNSEKIKSLLNTMNNYLELNESIFKKSNSIIEKVLKGGTHLTREELLLHLEKAKISTAKTRSSHLLMRAELDEIICSGATKNKKQTYCLLAERVPKKKLLSREEALIKLAKKYFTSHAPASLVDFVWWSGLPIKEARIAVDGIKSDFIIEKINSKEYYFSNTISKTNNENSSVYLLPAFDEFLISYRDRSASLKETHQKNTISTNGIFRPVIVINGEITGLWKRTIVKDKVVVETSLFRPHTKSNKNLIEQQVELFGQFLGMKSEVKHTTSK